MFRILKPSSPIVAMRPEVLDQIMQTIGSRPPETGGILLGLVGEELIDDFYFDSTADCSQVTYSPDTQTLREKLATEWLPVRDFKGFAHSHPTSVDEPSSGDLQYIARLLAANPDMEQFVCPIVIPDEFRIGVFIVQRKNPKVAVRAQLELQHTTPVIPKDCL